MLYRIQAKNGWATLTISEQEAKDTADMYHRQWWGMGVDMLVEVYRDGDLIYTAQGKPATS